jgi:hypothetical protein
MKYDRRHKVIVVGNSPNLLNYSMGNIIDEHSIVIRCNYCHTNGFESSTGSKTDIWSTTMTHNKCNKRDRRFLEKHNKTHSNRSDLLFSPNEIRQKMVWLRHDTNREYIEKVVKKHHGKDIKWENMGNGHIDKFKLGHPAGPLHFCNEIYKQSPWIRKHFNSNNRWVVTTGVATILYALTKYKKVNIVGFSFYTENALKTNKTYNGLVLKENLRKDAYNHTLILEPFVSNNRINFIVPEERKLFYNIFNNHIK